MSSCYYHNASLGYYLHFVSSSVLLFAVFSLKCMRMSDVGYPAIMVSYVTSHHNTGRNVFAFCVYVPCCIFILKL